VRLPNLVSIPGFSQISPLNFSATSDNSSVTVSVSGTKLLVTANSVGTAHITVTATDLDGAAVSQMFTVDVIAAPGRLVNISTRGQVGADPNALIGSLILGGSESKQVLIRAIGPSLTGFGISNALTDPTLELRDQNGALKDSNDDWMNSPQKTQIQNSGLAP